MGFNRLGGGLNIMLIAAILIGTLRHRACFQKLLNQVAGPALRTLFRNGPAPGDEIAIGIPITAIECPASLRAPLHDFALGAVRAFYADGLLFDEFTLRIVAASDKLTIPAELLHQVVSALRALLFERLIRFLDETDNHMELEDVDEDGEGEDAEPSLGSFDRMLQMHRSLFPILMCRN